MDAFYEASCVEILKEIQIEWDEMGLPSSERNKKLVKLQTECQELYKKLSRETTEEKNKLIKASLKLEKEIVNLHSILGEASVKIDSLPEGLLDRITRLCTILSELNDRKKKRGLEFFHVREKLEKLIFDLTGNLKNAWRSESDSDLSYDNLQTLYARLETLSKEKEKRIAVIIDELLAIKDLCLVLGTDLRTFFTNLNVFLDLSKVNWSNLDIQSQRENINVQDSIMPTIKESVQHLSANKRQRMEKMSDLGASLVTLWDLLETSEELQRPFEAVSKNIAVSMVNFNQPGLLSLDCIHAAEKEVERLQLEKTKKMKELVFKRRIKLEEICSKSHLIPPSDTAPEATNPLLESGNLDAESILEQIDEQIARITEEDLSRHDILQLVEKWRKFCEAEKWLEEFEKDANRYGGQKGRHMDLKQAELSRDKVKKIPQIIKGLLSKVEAWEAERRQIFFYDGASLSDVLKEDSAERIRREDEKKRMMELKIEERKKLTEEEALFGSMPRSLVKGNRKNNTLPVISPANRRLSFGPNQDPTPIRVAGAIRIREVTNPKREKTKVVGPSNVVALHRQENNEGILDRSPLSNLDPVSPALNLTTDEVKVGTASHAKSSTGSNQAIDLNENFLPKRLESHFN